jgi:hypothetical protein
MRMHFVNFINIFKPSTMKTLMLNLKAFAVRANKFLENLGKGAGYAKRN